MAPRYVLSAGAWVLLLSWCAMGPRAQAAPPDTAPTRLPSQRAVWGSDEPLIAQAEGTKVHVLAVGKQLETLTTAEFPAPVTQLAWDPTGALWILLENRTAFRLAGDRRDEIRLPPKTAFEFDCPTYADGDDSATDEQRWEAERCLDSRVTHPSGRLHLIPGAPGGWLADCVSTGGEANSACILWRSVPLSDRRAAQAKTPSPTAFQYVRELQRTPWFRYFDPHSVPEPDGVRFSADRSNGDLLQCRLGRGRPVSIRGHCDPPGTSMDEAWCGSLEDVRWVSTQDRVYLVTQDVDVSGEFPTLVHYLFRACSKRPLAVFSRIAWGPDGLWAHDGKGWVVRRGGTVVGRLPGGSTPIFGGLDKLQAEAGDRHRRPPGSCDGVSVSTLLKEGERAAAAKADARCRMGVRQVRKSLPSTLEALDKRTMDASQRADAAADRAVSSSLGLLVRLARRARQTGSDDDFEAASGVDDIITELKEIRTNTAAVAGWAVANRECDRAKLVSGLPVDEACDFPSESAKVRNACERCDQATSVWQSLVADTGYGVHTVDELIDSAMDQADSLIEQLSDPDLTPDAAAWRATVRDLNAISSALKETRQSATTAEPLWELYDLLTDEDPSRDQLMDAAQSLEEDGPTGFRALDSLVAACAPR